MASRTQTSTHDGDVTRDVDDDGTVTMRTVCKLCYTACETQIGATDNVFHRLAFRHTPNCRFHPDARRGSTS